MDNENFILVKLNKLVSTLENEVESVFSDLSEEDLQDLIDNDIGSVIFEWKGQALEERGRRQQQELIDFTLRDIDRTHNID
ncbi:MAG: hypothetical protein CBE47_00805 [Pelagibacteraceae bacterium TMED287]|jgi:hypothetical protein|nr:MAG: hypothetical protein CBE47_00805 [Pelagibacteraceae bacterium TMED287]|tara:strand:- start:331 stop:573 length:243 start_codon:yes stop_codon:yes gene_type:complete